MKTSIFVFVTDESDGEFDRGSPEFSLTEAETSREYESERERRRREEQEKEERKRQSERDFQEELRKIMEAEQVSRSGLIIIGRHFIDSSGWFLCCVGFPLEGFTFYLFSK